MGDIIHAPALAPLLSLYLGKNSVRDLTLEEEYHNAEPLTKGARAVLGLSREPTGDRGGRGVLAVGCFDTLVGAYAPSSGGYDHVLPMQWVRPLHRSRMTVAEQHMLRRLLCIPPTDRILVVSSVSCIDPEDLSFSHPDSAIATDFAVTNEARVVPTRELRSLIAMVLDEGVADRVVIVPRNISEELARLDELASYPESLLISESTLTAGDGWRTMILAAKGVLRAIYAIADTVIVMGWHNMMEPYCVNEALRVYCFKPPAGAPCYDMWRCGTRLGVLESLPPVPPGERTNSLAGALRKKWTHGRFKWVEYVQDPHVRCAYKNAIASLETLALLLANRNG